MAGVTRVREIDLNADLGEGFDDAAILPYLSSCSIACGAHAGDAATMRSTLVAAHRRGVACGAHPGYPDRAGFGRRELPMTLSEIAESVLEQIGMLSRVAREEGVPVGHVKPHGALYHVCHRRRDAARAVAEAVAHRHPRLAVIGMPGSILLDEAERAGLRTVAEGFADRLYLEDGTLAPRGSAGAVHGSPARAAEQALTIARDETVVAATGAELALPARTICIHGDSPGAVEIARAVREKLASAGVEVRPFSAQRAPS
ncbi:MAG TPA: 5-oxoprolinase subunit PxpA [Thermoanaerobaculia bacterium]|nr:5-oxoprolinase subunit PxpA [Thermoanaerobaculia bacterium]